MTVLPLCKGDCFLQSENWVERGDALPRLPPFSSMDVDSHDSSRLLSSAAGLTCRLPSCVAWGTCGRAAGAVCITSALKEVSASREEILAGFSLWL